MVSYLNVLEGSGVAVHTTHATSLNICHKEKLTSVPRLAEGAIRDPFTLEIIDAYLNGVLWKFFEEHTVATP